MRLVQTPAAEDVLLSLLYPSREKVSNVERENFEAAGR